MTAGIGIPMIVKIVGAISANFPLLIFPEAVNGIP